MRQPTITLRSRSAWILLAVYLAAAVALTAGALVHGSTRILGSFPDPMGFVWWLAAAEHWVAHGGSLFRPDLINVPTGESALWNTSVLGLGVPAVPITALFGPIVTYNILITIGIALDAWVMALAAGRWTSRPAAVLAGFIFGFGAYTVSQAEAHLHLVFVAYLPIMAILVTDLYRGASSRWKTGVLVAVATAWQFFISTEVLVTCAIFAGVVTVAIVVSAPGRWRRITRLAVDLIPGAVLACVLLAYPLAYALSTATRRHLLTRAPSIYSANLANLFIPTPVQLFDERTMVFAGNLAEGGMYLGVPLLIVLAIGVIATWRRQPITRVLVISALVMMVFAIGPTLHYETGSLPVPLPWRIVVDIVPLLSNVVPARMDLYVYFCAALATGVTLDEARRRVAAGRLNPFAVSAAVLVTLLVLLPRPIASYPTAVPAFFSGPSLDADIPAGSLVITVPPAKGTSTVAPALWQAVAKMRYRTTGAFWEDRPVSDPSPVTRWLDPTPTDPISASEAHEALVRDHVYAVLVPHTANFRRTVRRVAEITGGRASLHGGMVVLVVSIQATTASRR